MRKSCKGCGVRGGGLAEGRGGCSARSTAAQSSRTPAQPITLRKYPTWPAFDVNQQTLGAESNRRLVGSNVRSNQVSAETELGGSEGARAGAYGGEGQCYTRRCPCNPAPNTFQTSGINSFASPFLSSRQICTKAEQVHQKQQREMLGRRAVRGPEWGSDADPQCSRRWLNAISPPASHGSALMCWNASGVPAQMPSNVEAEI